MKNTLMGTETVPMEGVHLVQKLYSFLYIPGAAWKNASALASAPPLQKASQTPGGPLGKISGLGKMSDLPVGSERLPRKSELSKSVESHQLVSFGGDV